MFVFIIRSFFFQPPGRACVIMLCFVAHRDKKTTLVFPIQLINGICFTSCLWTICPFISPHIHIANLHRAKEQHTRKNTYCFIFTFNQPLLRHICVIIDVRMSLYIVWERRCCVVKHFVFNSLEIGWLARIHCKMKRSAPFRVGWHGIRVICSWNNLSLFRAASKKMSTAPGMMIKTIRFPGNMLNTDLSFRRWINKSVNPSLFRHPFYLHIVTIVLVYSILLELYIIYVYIIWFGW